MAPVVLRFRTRYTDGRTEMEREDQDVTGRVEMLKIYQRYKTLTLFYYNPQRVQKPMQ